MEKTLLIAALTGASLLGVVGVSHGQVAGSSTTTGVTVTENTQIAMGWSVKKTVLGKTVYNDTGTKIGNVEDLIISPQRKLSYAIIGAGGFVGMGRHDVAVPVSQLENRSGKLVMVGASKEALKSLPAFAYAPDTTQRDQFIARTDRDIATGRQDLTAWEKKASLESKEVKAGMDKNIAAAHVDLKLAETKLGEMKDATANRWKTFEAGVTAATERMHRSLEKAKA